MDQRILFQQRLGEIRDIAQEQGNRISRAQIETHFSNTDLTGEQIDLICSYLEDQRIVVDRGSGAQAEEALPAPGMEQIPEAGRITEPKTIRNQEAGSGRESVQNQEAGRSQESFHEQEAEQGQESGQDREQARKESYLEEFLAEIGQMRAPEAAEELKLFHRAVKKDPEARDTLTRLYLQTVCSLAAEYESEDLPGEDLLQEGSVGLLMALDNLPEMDSLAAYRTRLFNEVNQYLEQVIKEHKAMEDAGSAALKKVQRLDEAMQSLMEDLGRKVTMEELSAFLEMPVSEIRDIARLAGDDLEFADSPADLRMPWEI